VLGETTGGQGLPVGDIPGVEELFPLPELGGVEPVVDPVFGVELPGAPAVPGKVPQGDPLGLVPGAVDVFGSTVEG
jgi:hypothetical protein